jgi:ADP-ribose pyrophosphatase YjhB (NUDIX family)
MTTQRRFAAFQKDNKPPRMSVIPDGGLCLSAFLAISKTGKPNDVLLGRMNSDAPWNHLCALDEARMERHGTKWVLPSSHLILGESPEDAAKRILMEQLGLEDQPLEGPLVFSEVYDTCRAKYKDHWDIHFVFLGERDEAPSYWVWRELRFVDLTITKKEEFARAHEDILSLINRHIGE